MKELQLGTKTASYRSYAPGSICFAGRDYQPTLKGELTAMNELLAAFLQGTSAGPEGVWADEHVQMLEKAQTGLVPALDAYEATLAQTRDCLFEHKYEFPELTRKGQEYVRQARQRVADSATLLPVVRARAELAKWKEQLTKDQESEHSNWCPPKPRPAPDVYFALEDENGRTEWLFCDGTKVVSNPGKSPEYVAPQEGRPASKGMQGSYLRAAAKYPTSQIRRAPRPPAQEPSATAGESPGTGGR